MQNSKVLGTSALSVLIAMQIPVVYSLQMSAHRQGLGGVTAGGNRLLEAYASIMLLQWDLATFLGVVLVLVLQRLRSDWIVAIFALILIYGLVSCLVLTARGVGVFIWWH